MNDSIRISIEADQKQERLQDYIDGGARFLDNLRVAMYCLACSDDLSADPTRFLLRFTVWQSWSDRARSDRNILGLV
jgi:hypothetical protein